MIELMLCCNNQHGNFTGKVVRLDLLYRNEILASFEVSVSLSLSAKYLKLGKLKLNHISYKQYVGNIMWDQYIINPTEANKLWRYLLKLKQIALNEALTDLWEAWENKLNIDFNKIIDSSRE